MLWSTYPHRLTAMLDKVFRVHHDKWPEQLDQLKALWEPFIGDLLVHFHKEETIYQTQGAS